jgi:hypothetical protein
VALAASAWIAAAPDTQAQDLTLSYSREGRGAAVTARLSEAGGERFALFASDASNPAAPRFLVGAAGVDAEGRGVLTFPIADLGRLPAGLSVRFTAVLVGRDLSVREVGHDFGVTVPHEMFDWDYVPRGGSMPAGKVLSDEYLDSSLLITGTNAVAGHPDMVAVFDSSNVPPCSGDPDLATPGYGPGNDQPLGMLLVIPENAIDASPMDGLLDCPDDEAGGGVLHFDFSPAARLSSITLVDIDDRRPSELRFYDGARLTQTLPIENRGDNSVQTLNFDISPVSRLDVVLGGSGGVASIGASICPMRIDFDTSTTGVPLGMPAGSILHDQLEAMGIELTASNANSAHPDLPILFDSANPTGGDPDLATPGYGAGNDDPAAESQRYVLILAENDWDGNADGLIDVPDDEALGGVLTMRFAESMVFHSAGVLDVDGTEGSEFRLFGAGGEVLSILPLAPLGDNSLQQVAPANPVLDVRRIELHLGNGIATGSGAWADLQVCPQVLFGLGSAPDGRLIDEPSREDGPSDGRAPEVSGRAPFNRRP